MAVQKKNLFADLRYLRYCDLNQQPLYSTNTLPISETYSANENLYAGLNLLRELDYFGNSEPE